MKNSPLVPVAAQATCAACNGAGRAPGSWTLERAKASPEEFNGWWARYTRGDDKAQAQPRGQPVIEAFAKSLEKVVSPGLFTADGHAKCYPCRGRGHALRA